MMAASSILFTHITGGAAKPYGRQEQVSPVMPDKLPTGKGVIVSKTAERIITVGGPGSDIAGYTSATIQIAVDAIKSRGGGVVRLTGGTFEITGPIRLAGRISLIGAGKTTILHKADGYRSPLVTAGEHGMLKITVRDTAGFRPGMGIQVHDNINKRGWGVTTAKITAIEGNVLYIDNYLVAGDGYSPDKQGMVSNACSLVEVVEAEDVRIADFVIDGNKQTNDNICSTRGGGVYLHKARRCLIENVEVKNFNGDGISWQISEDITVRNCQVHHCADFGLHPGTGAVGTTIEDCSVHHNGTDGIYLCWRVQNGVFRKNTIYQNGRFGISIGHKDTDNVFANNHIYENARHGVYFRRESKENGSHRNTFHSNVVENNGTKNGGYGFWVDGAVRDIIIENNTIRDTGKGFQKSGVYIGKNASNIKVVENQMAGHEKGDVFDRSVK